MLRSESLLKYTLLLVGLAISLLGLDFAVGGIATLGWQVDPGYVAIADPTAYQIQDNHIRFLGGLFVATGLTYVIGSFLIGTMRPALISLSLMIAVAGLFRLGAMEAALTPSVLPSLLLELLAFPALALWLWRGAA